MNPNEQPSPYDPNTPQSSRPDASSEWPDSQHSTGASQPSANPTPPQTTNYVQPQANWPAFMHENPSDYRPSQQQFNPNPSSVQQQPLGPVMQPIYSTPKSKRFSAKTLLISLVAVLLLGGGSVLAFTALRQGPTPDQVFKTSLINALSTQSFTQKSVQKADDQSLIITQKQNVKDIKDVRVSTNVTFDSTDVKLDFDGYGKFTQAYFKLNDVDTSQAINRDIFNKWVSLDPLTDKDSPVSSISTLRSAYDPNFAALGNYIFGDFSTKQREELVSHVINNNVYKYDAAKVTKGTVGNEAVYVYKVKTDEAKLQTYDKKVAAMMGIDSELFDTVLSGLRSQEVTWKVSIKSQQLIEVTTSEGKTTYSEWNQTRLPSEPEAQLTYKEFNSASQASTTTPTSTASGIAARAYDTERKTDINSLYSYLEASYANNGFYPTFEELNDASWRDANMSGLDEEALRDPTGTSTSLSNSARAGTYSYMATGAGGSCDNVSTYCDYYQVTATLSDGSAYSKVTLY